MAEEAQEVDMSADPLKPRVRVIILLSNNKSFHSTVTAVQEVGAG